MMLRPIIGLTIFGATLALIIIRPRGITEATAALGGAALLLLGGYIGPLQALSILGNEWNVFGFFLGLMSISALSEQAGIFEAVAQVAAPSDSTSASSWLASSSRPSSRTTPPR